MLYGTTGVGGTGTNCPFASYYGCGTIVSMSPSGQEKVLYSFNGGTDGYLPSAALLPVNGVLYGTTEYGGNNGCYNGGNGCGTVFSVSTSGTEKVLHIFTLGADGGQPSASLITLKGVLYGTTMIGGSTQNCIFNGRHYGCGTIFSISPSGKEKVVYFFKGGADGQTPIAGLTNVNGTLYGTTINGGSSGDGTVFLVTTSGQEKVLHSFKGGADGNRPWGGLVNLNGILYGTTVYGGGYGCYAGEGCGSIFSISTSGEEKVVYSFKGGTDGASPAASLVAVKGVFYGTTHVGGSSTCNPGFGCGTIFSLTTSGREKVLHRFTGGMDGGFPWGLYELNGVLYGTTFECLTHGSPYGTVFKLLP
jgi:uncharacterized repeat protein (TIGR03803 family)